MLTIAVFSIIIAIALPSINITNSVLVRTTSICLFAAAVMVANTFCITGIGHGLAIYNGLFQITPLTTYGDILILCAGTIAILPWSPQGTNNSTPPSSTYSLFILFSILGSLNLLSSNDLISIYLSIELQSFAVYILATLYRDSESSTHAGLLYFLLGGLSSSIILLGSGLIYTGTGHTNLESIQILIQNTPRSTTPILGSVVCVGGGPDTIIMLGLTIIAVGFFFKVTAAPFHNWGPDVYDGVPTIVTIWLSVLPKISIIILLLELTNNLGKCNGLSNLILVSSFLSLLVGTIVGLVQVRIKRLLAYSTISHVGFLFLALSGLSTGSIESFIFYLGQYTITALNAFLVLLAIGYVLNQSPPQGPDNWLRHGEGGADISVITELKGVFYNQPLLGLSLAISLFSIAGVPPLIGFFGKQSVLSTVLQGGYYYIAFVAIIVSVISAGYYLYVIRVVHFDVDNTQSQNTQSLTSVHSYIISFFTILITFFITYSGIIFDSINLVALTIYSV